MANLGKVILVLSVYALAFLAFGSLVTAGRNRREISFSKTLLAGFFLYHAVFQITALPFMFLQKPLSLLAMFWGAAAAAVFIGQNTGAGETGRVRDGFHTGQRLLAGLGLFMSLVMLLGAEPFLQLVLPAGSPASLEPAMGYLRLVACFYLFNFLGSGLAGYFRGRGRVNLPVIGATGHISLRAALSLLLAPMMGLPAVALATGLGWIGVVTFWYVFARQDLEAAKKTGGTA